MVEEEAQGLWHADKTHVSYRLVITLIPSLKDLSGSTKSSFSIQFGRNPQASNISMIEREKKMLEKLRMKQVLLILVREEG